MHKPIKQFPLARTCRLCKIEISAVLMHDDDGYYVREVCGCDENGINRRLNAYDVSDYLNELRKRIEAEREIVDVLAKYSD